MGQQDLRIQELVIKIEHVNIRLSENATALRMEKNKSSGSVGSLYRGYPSGILLTWETDSGVAERKFAVDQGDRSNSFQLLLGGQKRLTSLSAILQRTRGDSKLIREGWRIEQPELQNQRGPRTNP